MESVDPLETQERIEEQASEEETEEQTEGNKTGKELKEQECVSSFFSCLFSCLESSCSFSLTFCPLSSSYSVVLILLRLLASILFLLLDSFIRYKDPSVEEVV